MNNKGEHLNNVHQARRQEFPEGGSSTRVALTAGGLGVFGTKS